MATVRYIVEDTSAAVDFYCDHLGFEVVMQPGPGFAMLARDDLRLALNSPGSGGGGATLVGSATPEPGGWNRIQLEVDDLEEVERRLAASGISGRSEIVDGRGGRQMLVEDPSGNRIELFEPRREG